MMWFLGVIQRPRQDWAWVRDRPCAVLTGLTTASWSRSCRCGDEIVEINESPVPCMTLNEVHSVLSHCEPGPVPIIVSRHPDPQVTSLWVPLPQAHVLFQYKDWNQTWLGLDPRVRGNKAGSRGDGGSWGLS